MLSAQKQPLNRLTSAVSTSLHMDSGWRVEWQTDQCTTWASISLRQSIPRRQTIHILVFIRRSLLYRKLTSLQNWATTLTKLKFQPLQLTSQQFLLTWMKIICSTRKCGVTYGWTISDPDKRNSTLTVSKSISGTQRCKAVCSDCLQKEAQEKLLKDTWILWSTLWLKCLSTKEEIKLKVLSYQQSTLRQIQSTTRLRSSAERVMTNLITYSRVPIRNG